jgi:hypothetical protein
MAIKEYCKNVFRIAFSGACAAVNAVSFILSTFVEAYLWLCPPKESTMKDLGAIIPCITFFGVLLFTLLIVAPYQIYKKQQEEIEKLQRERNVGIEKLKQRLASTAKEIKNLMDILSHERATMPFLQDNATIFLIQRWLDSAKISLDYQNKYFGRYTCLPTEVSLVRDCYVLILVEDWINNSKAYGIFLKTTCSFFKGCIEQMERDTGIPISIKITPSAIIVHNKKLFGSKPFEFRPCLLEDALARNAEEKPDHADIVIRVKNALSDTKKYLKTKELLKEETI